MTPDASVEKALCMNADDLLALLEDPSDELKLFGDPVTLEHFFLTNAYLEPVSEIKPGTPHRQVVPYVTLFDEMGKVYVFNLQDNLVSAGISWTIEIEPTKYRSLVTVMVESIIRQLNLKVGWSCANGYGKVMSGLLSAHGFIHSDETETSKLALGISIIVEVKRSETTISDDQWMLAEEALEKHDSDFFDMEPWSVKVLNSPILI